MAAEGSPLTKQLKRAKFLYSPPASALQPFLCLLVILVLFARPFAISNPLIQKIAGAVAVRLHQAYTRVRPRTRRVLATKAPPGHFYKCHCELMVLGTSARFVLRGKRKS